MFKKPTKKKNREGCRTCINLNEKATTILQVQGYLNRLKKVVKNRNLSSYLSQLIIDNYKRMDPDGLSSTVLIYQHIVKSDRLIKIREEEAKIEEELKELAKKIKSNKQVKKQ